ncbi:cobW-domain-containing protein [Ramaria rubella]|nr:cobW-domain-containing protein [Ramaria rubella]
MSHLKHTHKRVPITLICGFLGAGKSTLLKRILTEKHGYRIAVIMNEFGDTAKAIKVPSMGDANSNLDQAPEEFLELANGCLCCSIKDSGVAAIEKLMSRKGIFDHILLETTGIADPGPIAAMFWQNEEFAMGLGKDIYLDGVICVVDAVFAEQQIREDTESEGIKHSLRQIAAADVLLLNKSDLVAASKLAETEFMLHDLNPSIPIYTTVRGQIDLSKVMGIGAYSDRPGAFEAHQHEHKTCSDHTHRHHDHGAQLSSKWQHGGISSILIPVTDPLTEDQMQALDGWIRSALWDNEIPRNTTFLTNPGYNPPAILLADELIPGVKRMSVGDSGLDGKIPVKPEILRCKGIWWNTRGEQFILQGVRNLYEISQVQETPAVGTRAGKLVFIGKGLCQRVADSLMGIVSPLGLYH